MMIGRSKKQASINGEMFNIYCSLGWKFLNFLKKVESNRAIFHKKKKMKIFVIKKSREKTTRINR